MSSEEQKQILKMVEQGRISAGEAMKLIKALEESSAEVDLIEVPSTSSSSLGTSAPATSSGFEAGSESRKPDAPEFEEIAQKARRLWQIPLWIGILVVVLSSYWLYTLVNASNLGFWFYCAWVPLLFGVVLLALFATSQTSRWLYVKVEQPPNEWPRNIAFGFPLPLGLAGWFLRNFGHNIQSLSRTNVDEIVEILSTGFSSKEPLIVNVDEGRGGERVQVYIG